MITLTKTSTEFGEIAIVKSRIKGSHIYWHGQWQQSEADRNGRQPGDLRARHLRSVGALPLRDRVNVNPTWVIACRSG
jgi:hypothetical protein